MTASELLYSVDGKVRLDVKLDLSTLTITSIFGGKDIVDMIFRFSGLDNEILNKPARIWEPVGGFTYVVVGMEDFKKKKGKKK